MPPLPKTANPAYIANNADVDFAITPEDLEALKAEECIADYGDVSFFPVYGDKL